MQSPFHAGGSLLCTVWVFAMAFAVGTACAEEPGAAGAGMRIYRDPATGQIGVPPPGSVGPAERAVRPLAPLVESPGTSPAGGWKLDSSGLPLNAFVATRDAAGNVQIECVPMAGRE